jgi:formate-dependent phosphoribosylglycinamide formyltransferase (GAR transformylase)
MVLGAGPNQVSLIRKAKQLGNYVISVDYLPDNIGHKYSDQSINCSTIDKNTLLYHARKERIDGIITIASDIATGSVAYVAEEMGLSGCALKVAELLSNKAHFRNFQKSSKDLNKNNFLIIESLSEIGKNIISPPFMVKPVDSSGSKGITRIDDFSQDELVKAFEEAKKVSRSGKVSIEQYVEGTDVSGDGFMMNGKIAFCLITEKIKDGYKAKAHILPTNINKHQESLVLNEVEKTCREAGYLDGPFDFDVMVNNERAFVVEISPRLGGNGIPNLIEFSTQVSIIEENIKFALGEMVSFPKHFIVKHMASWIYGIHKNGTLSSIAGDEYLKSKYPYIKEINYHKKPGDLIEHFNHSGNSIFNMIFGMPDGETFEDIKNQIIQDLNITIH